MKRIVVIKHGGSAMEDPAHNHRFAAGVAELVEAGYLPVIIHGGGKEISRYLDRLGIATRFVDGQRYTSAEALEPIEMVLSGKINKELVRLLGMSGVSALGLSGKDGQLLRAERIAEPDLGFVGEVYAVNSELLRALIDICQVPVISPVSLDDAGQTLNVNADYAAVAVAIALNAELFIYVTDVDGIQIGGAPLRAVSLSEAKDLLVHPEVRGGMIPKLQCIIDALDSGVASVRMLDGTSPIPIGRALAEGATYGTTFSRE